MGNGAGIQAQGSDCGLALRSHSWTHPNAVQSESVVQFTNDANVHDPTCASSPRGMVGSLGCRHRGPWLAGDGRRQHPILRCAPQAASLRESAQWSVLGPQRSFLGWTQVCFRTFSSKPPIALLLGWGEREGGVGEPLSPGTDSHMGPTDSLLMAASPLQGGSQKTLTPPAVPGGTQHRQTPGHSLHRESAPQVGISFTGSASPSHPGQRTRSHSPHFLPRLKQKQTTK